MTSQNKKTDFFFMWNTFGILKLHLLEAIVKTNGKMSASKAESCKSLHVTIHELVIQGESWYILVVYIDKEK